MEIQSKISRTNNRIDNSILIERIKELKEKRDAIILAHFYQRPEIQDIADKVGDSLELAKFAHNSNASVLVFAGVVFMAETAKILNPNLKVLVPDMTAGCGLADSCPPHLFKQFVDKHPDRVVVSYINTSAEVKAMSDIICTSSNALSVINSIPYDKKILFAPDKNLGAYIKNATKRDIICWEGVCYVHEAFSIEKILRLRLNYPTAKILAHPESDSEVIMLADFVGSTSAMIKYVEESGDVNFIIATEGGIIHDINKKVNGKNVIAAPTPDENSCACSECAYMKVNTLTKIYETLLYDKTEINLSDKLLSEARVPLLKMIESN